MKKHLSNILLGLAFVVGLALLLYPSISNFVNQQNASRAVASYEAATQDMSAEEIEKALQAARAYNEALTAAGSSAFYEPDTLSGYEDLLDITGTGAMGYITINKIGVQLPIYHGTDEGVLAAGAGHLQGSSLPVGGESTHSVICGHRGLPSAKLFTDLDQLEVGDTFVITVLGKKYTYEVDLISIVEPDDTSKLQIVQGSDLVTLQTCTPYGINTQRLLVRGHRVANSDLVDTLAADAVQMDSTLVAAIISVPVYLILIVVLFVRSHLRRSRVEGK